MAPDLQEARTAAFTVLVLAQLVYALNCRSDRHSLFTVGVHTNTALLGAIVGSLALQATLTVSPWTREVFVLVPLSFEHWALACGLGLLPLPMMELWKAGLRWSEKRRSRLL